MSRCSNHQVGQVGGTGDERGRGYRMHPLRKESTHLTCISAIPMWKRRESGPSSLECRQVSSEDDGASCSPVRIWKKGYTIGSHITLLWAFPRVPGGHLPSGATIMSLGEPEVGCSPTGLSMELVC
jgi:hypothetical protein